MKRLNNNNKSLKKALFGLAIGFVNGFFGGGGGMIAVPAMRMLGLETKECHASAIFVILPISIASTITYITTNSLNLDGGLPIIISVVVGGAVGSLLLKKLQSKVIEIVFAVVMIGAGVRMMF